MHRRPKYCSPISASQQDGTDVGYGGNMRQMRWAQRANYGSCPNPAMPNTFCADAYDLGDPWNTPICTTGKGTYNGAPFDGTGCCVARTLGPSAQCTAGDFRGVFALNATRDWGGLGPLHPRLKRPVGERLARGLHTLAYNDSETIARGPAFAGCRTAREQLELSFDVGALRGERVTFNVSNTVAMEDTALYVLSVNSSFDIGAFRRDVEANHHRISPTNQNEYRGPFSDGNEMGVEGWVAVAAKSGSAPNTLLIDLSGRLPAGMRVAALRYGVGSGGYDSATGEKLDRGLGGSRLCCGPFRDPVLEPCLPERCPIKAGLLPAVPFFAAVEEDGRCSCFKPMTCDSPAF